MSHELVLIKRSTVQTNAATPNQCKDIGHTSYDYEIEVVTDGRLDENGFIIDHSVIHETIKNVIQNKMGSCEQLCLRVEQDVRELLNKRGTLVDRMVFMIKPNDSNAWVKIVGKYESTRTVYPEPTFEELTRHLKQ